MGNKHSKQQQSARYVPNQYAQQYAQQGPINTVGTPEYIADRQKLCIKSIKQIEEYLVSYTEENINSYKEAIKTAKVWAENNKILLDEYNELKKSPAIINIDQLQKYTQDGVLENEIMLETCTKFLEKINTYVDEYQQLTRYYDDWYKVNKNIEDIYEEIDILMEYYKARPLIHTEEITTQIQHLSDKMATIQCLIIESGISEINTLWKSCISPASINYGIKHNCNKLIKNITTIKDMIKLIDLETQEFMG